MSTDNKFWFLALITVFGFAFAVFALEEPYGKISGQVAIKREGYGIPIKELNKRDKVYALVSGPNYSNHGRVERGTWVRPDGKFQIERLPVGEYTLRVKAPGFSSFNQYGLYVQEAKNNFVKDIVLQPQEAYGAIASNTRVFTSKEVPYFWVNSNGGTKAKIKIYKTDILKLIQSKNPDFQIGDDLRLYKPNKNPEQILKDQVPVSTIERPLYPDYNDWSRTEIKLIKPLPKGDYLISLDLSNEANKHDYNWSWFSVTDKGLIIKHAPDRTVIRAINLLTLKPINGLTIHVSEGTQQIFSKQTDAKGFLEVKVPDAYRTKANYNWLIYSTDSEDKTYGALPYWGGEVESYKTYFYTEKPVYRLGQTVYYKAITRLIDENGLKLPKNGSTVQVSVENPDGEEFAKYSTTINVNGSFNGLVEIPNEGKTGAYSLKFIFPDGSYTYGSFEVAQYKKPEYKVEVTPLQKRIKTGSKLKARVSANYFFGAPVKNARVKYTVYTQTDWMTRYKLTPRPAYYSYYDDWNDNYYDENYNGDYFTEGTAVTDENGIAEIEVETEATKSENTGPYTDEFNDKFYKIQADVTDLSRMTVSGSGKVLVTPGDYVLFVDPEKYIYKTGEEIEAKVMAVDYEGNLLSGKNVSLSLNLWKYNPKKNNYSEHVVGGKVSARTDENGMATFKLKTKNNVVSENYYLTAQGEGGNITTKTSIWIANENSPYQLSSSEAKSEAVSVKLDKAVYKPGEIAKVLVSAPVTGKEGIQALVSVEGNKLYEYRSVPMDASAITIDVSVKKEYKPNAYISVALVAQNHQLYTQSVMLKVTPEDSFLSLNIKTDKAKYKPGETVNYQIQALNSLGKPVQGAELSLGVVDESIYSIRPETAEDIKKYFYQRNENRVMTLSSFPEQYSGGPDKFEPKLRKEFKDTALWIPDLITDANGVAKASVKLPDNLTSWRATVRALTHDSSFGSATQNIVSTQDIIARLALPRFFTQYDEGLLTGIVHNYSDKEQVIRLSLDASEHFKIDEEKSLNLTVPSGGAERKSWKVKLISAGEGKVSLQAVTASDGDALENKLFINPLGLPISFSQNGSLQSIEESKELTLQNIPESEVHLSLSASPLAGALGSLDNLIDYPYGCTEQTMSRLMPAIVAEQTSQKLNITLAEETNTKLSEVKKQALEKLKDYQHENGAWGWWKEDQENIYLTAYVLEGLYYLKDSVNQELSTKGLIWLKTSSETLRKQLASPKRSIEKNEELDKLIDLAQADYVISLWEGNKNYSKSVEEFWMERLNQLTPESLSYIVLAFPQQKLAQKAFTRLETLLNKKSNYFNWDHSNDLFKKLGLKEAYTYRFTGIETTALALRAATVMKYKNTDSIVSWLLLQRDKDGWNNTKTTAQVLKALAEHSLQSSSSEINFKVLSNLFDAITFDSTNAYISEVKYKWPKLSSLPETVIKLTKTGPGKLYYWLMQSYYQFLKPGERIHSKPLPEGLKLTRSFYKLKAKQLPNSDKIVFASEPILGSVKSGDIVLMRLKVESPVALPYIMLEAPLPSGGEVLIKDPKNDLLENSDSSFEGDWGEYWWTHQDVLDDKIVFFVTSLPVGKHEFHALIRTELPGEFNLNPFRLEGMYSKLIRANSELSHLKVSD